MHLEEIVLYGNYFTSIPDALFRLPKLRAIYLNECDLLSHEVIEEQMKSQWGNRPYDLSI